MATSNEPDDLLEEDLIADRGQILTFDLECVPDWQIAARLGIEKLERPEPEELSQLRPVEEVTAWKIDDIKSYVDRHYVPEEYLGSLRAIEKEAKKPRVTLLDHLDSVKKNGAGPLQRYHKQNKDLSVNARRCRPIALGWAFDYSEPSYVIVNDKFSEQDLLIKFWDLVSQSERQVAGYNIKNYDLRVICHRSPLFKVHSSRSFDVRRRGTKPILDLMEVYNAYGEFTSLKTLAAELDLHVPAGDMDGSQVQDAYLAGKHEEIGRYVCSDVHIVQELIKYQWGYLI